jgi:hypothetical protein
MAKYLLLESCGAASSNVVASCIDIATELMHAGHEVSVFLLDDGVVPACAGAPHDPLLGALVSGMEIWADERSLYERGFLPREVCRGVQVARIDLLVERLAGGWKAIRCHACT